MCDVISWRIHLASCFYPVVALIDNNDDVI